MQKKIPLRKCLATQEICPKKDLIRVVKNKEGLVFVDVTGRANGRGAYLKKSIEAVEKAQKTKCLDKALECKVPEEIYSELYELISK